MPVEKSIARVGGISFLRIPAKDPRRSAVFYASVFHWEVDIDRPEPSFKDGTGHVIGHFVANQAVAGEGGIRPYIFVKSVDEVLATVATKGGAVVTAPHREGELMVATFRDPEGNVVGVWQVSA